MHVRGKDLLVTFKTAIKFRHSLTWETGPDRPLGKMMLEIGETTPC
jgi:hypothetical protein